LTGYAKTAARLSFSIGQAIGVKHDRRQTHRAKTSCIAF